MMFGLVFYKTKQPKHGLFVILIILLRVSSNIMKNTFFWFRRDLRLEDNTALSLACKSGHKVIPVFIFDTNILNELEKDDARVSFIYKSLHKINEELKKSGSSLLIKKGEPTEVWKQLSNEYHIDTVYANRDYEPYAIGRDEKVNDILDQKGIGFKLFKDQVIFEMNEVLKDDGNPYTVFTPYKKKWLSSIETDAIAMQKELPVSCFHKQNFKFPTLENIGFIESEVKVLDYNLDVADNYANTRDIPALDQTSHLSPHLRFGTVSIRKIISKLKKKHEVFLSELIWREFFMQILYHFPHVVSLSFNPKYDNIKWRNNEQEFQKWCNGKTGYPMVDAGMRQLNQTGYMHNRVRMVTASFLCKHLLIDWRWGEAYFAKKLLDYELSSNNGNWQWAAGTGCDAAPYFRVFNPSIQLKKFDPDLKYVKKWVPELESINYPEPMVNHAHARDRALKTYKEGIKS